MTVALPMSIQTIILQMNIHIIVIEVKIANTANHIPLPILLRTFIQHVLITSHTIDTLNLFYWNQIYRCLRNRAGLMIFIVLVMT